MSVFDILFDVLLVVESLGHSTSLAIFCRNKIGKQEIRKLTTEKNKHTYLHKQFQSIDTALRYGGKHSHFRFLSTSYALTSCNNLSFDFQK